jgi:hypothetical protein
MILSLDEALRAGDLKMDGQRNGGRNHAHDPETIAFIRQMLGELRVMAEQQRCFMLCYLIEMAYVEAGDIQLGVKPSDIIRKKTDQSGRMTG